MRGRWQQLGLGVLAGLVVLGAGRVAVAAPTGVLSNPRARAHFERAQSHFDQQDYAAAIPELKAAYALEPNPMLLYAWGQAERLAGSCPRAVELYRRYLETDPPPKQRQLTEANLLDCEAEVPSPSPAEEAAPPSAEPEPTPEPEPAVSDEPSRRWFADPWGGVLSGVGVAGAVAGVALLGVSRREAREAEATMIEGDHIDKRERAERLDIAGAVVLGGSALLVLGGMIRYAVVAKRGRSGPQTAARRRRVVWTLSGAGLEGRF